MEIKEFKRYVVNLDAYSAQDVDEFEFMNDKELLEYQQLLERDAGCLSEWDHRRAFITMKMKSQKEVSEEDTETNFKEGFIQFKGTCAVDDRKVHVLFNCKAENFRVTDEYGDEGDILNKGFVVPIYKYEPREVRLDITPMRNKYGKYVQYIIE